MSGSRVNTKTSKAKEAFSQIWTQRQELQNWSSSSWWFFVLFPKQEKGYGPKQMMFTFASRAGELVKVNNTWQKGFDHKRVIGELDQFMTTVVGWINDGNHVHEEIVHQPALASLSSKSQKLEAWVDNSDGIKYGGEIKASNNYNLGLKAFFNGKDGFADFEAWSDDDDLFSIPQISDVRGPMNGKFGGTHLVAWRKIRFKGTFRHPCGEEELEGLGYFQRVAMNVPMFPWNWLWVLFEDETMFSAFIPYFGLQAFRRHHNFFRPSFERIKFNLMPVGYFNMGHSEDSIYFDKTKIDLLSINGKLSRDLLVLARSKSKNGDFINIYMKAHGHARFLLDRRVILKFWQTMFNYNEFMLEVVKIDGSINGKKLFVKKLGQGWGNLEYTWGLSL